MHSDVFTWVSYSYKKNVKTNDKIKILEFGSLDINGSIRSILEQHSSVYIGVDMQEGPGVDIVGNAKDFQSNTLFDLIVCCEVFEHTPEWPEIIINSHSLLIDGGLFIATMAGQGRFEHSAIDGGLKRPEEFYANVKASELESELKIFSNYEIDYIANDLRCWAIK